MSHFENVNPHHAIYHTNYEDLNVHCINIEKTIKLRKGFDSVINNYNSVIAFENQYLQFLQRRIRMFPRCLFAKQHQNEIEADRNWLKKEKARYLDCRDNVVVVNPSELEEVQDVQVFNLMMPFNMEQVNSDELGMGLHGIV